MKKFENFLNEKVNYPIFYVKMKDGKVFETSYAHFSGEKIDFTNVENGKVFFESVNKIYSISASFPSKEEE